MPRTQRSKISHQFLSFFLFLITLHFWDVSQNSPSNANLCFVEELLLKMLQPLHFSLAENATTSRNAAFNPRPKLLYSHVRLLFGNFRLLSHGHIRFGRNYLGQELLRSAASVSADSIIRSAASAVTPHTVLLY